MTTTLNARIVGQAENAHEAVLVRALAATGLAKRHWIALTLAATAGRPLDTGELTRQLADALRSADSATVRRVLDDLADAGLFTTEHTVTPAGQELFTRVRAETGRVLAPAYADIPEADLRTAARVLEVITDRLDGEPPGRP